MLDEPDRESFFRIKKAMEIFTEAAELNSIDNSDALSAMLCLSCWAVIDNAKDLDDAKEIICDYLDRLAKARAHHGID